MQQESSRLKVQDTLQKTSEASVATEIDSNLLSSRRDERTEDAIVFITVFANISTFEPRFMTSKSLREVLCACRKASVILSVVLLHLMK